MTIKEYIKLNIILGKQPNLKFIYEDLINLGYSPIEIYDAINEQIKENLSKAIGYYLRKKNEKE